MAIHKLGELLNVQNPKRIYFDEYQKNGVPFYRGQEITNKIFETDIFISQEKYDEIKKYNNVPKRNDILLGAVGTIGKPWLVNTDKPFYIKDGNVMWLNDFNNMLMPKFFLYWLESIGTYKIESVLIGGVQKALTKKDFLSIECDLPNLEVQKQIIDIIEPIEGLISACQNMQKKLISFGEFQFHHSEKCKMTVSDVATVEIGGTPSTSNKDFWIGEMPWINSGKLTNSFTSIESDKKISNEAIKKSRLAEKYDLLISIIDPSENKIALASENLAINQSIAVFKSEKNLYFEIKNAMKFFNMIKSGAAQQSINKSDILNTKIDVSLTNFNDLLMTVFKISEIQRIAEKLRTKAIIKLIK